MRQRSSAPARSTLAFALPALLALVAAPVQAQDTGTVTGRVIDSQTGQPLGSSQVFIPALDLGVLTEQNGRFTLSAVPSGDHSLTVQRLGYTAQNISFTAIAGETVTLPDVQLAQSALQLDALVITGTAGGTQRRAIGNAVAQIDATAITQRAQISTMQELLTARTPGLNFVRSSGNVGTGSAIRIRGVNSLTLGSQPLIYVDGVRMDNRSNAGGSVRGGSQTSALDDLNPNDIASIEVIKGPAAATLYGTEASAGVIQIITRRGETGAPQFELSVSQGANWLMDPAGKMGEQWGLVDGEPMMFGQYRNVYEHEKHVHGNDVFGYGHTQAYNLSVRGGTETVRYFLSGSWDDQKGVVSYNWNQRLGLRGNISVILPGSFNLDMSTGFVTGETSYMQQITEGGIWENMLWAYPGLMNTDRRGFLRYTPEELEEITSIREFQRFTGSATITHQIAELITHRLVIGIDRAVEENERLVPRHPDGLDGPFGALSLGDIILNRPLNSETTLDYGASASYRLNDRIAFTTSVGAQYNAREYNEIYSEGRVFPSPAIRSIEGATDKIVGQNFTQNKSVGFYVQQEVNLNERTFFTAALRGDDNSAFGADFSAQYYPKVSATWVISEESFWNQDWANSLRLRGAWGRAGRQPDTFAAVTLYAPYVGPGGTAAVTPSTVGNPNVGPEVSTELELGFEAAVLNDRIYGEFTYFTQRVDDALASVALIPSQGFSGAQSANLGRMDNWGWEASVNARVFERQGVAFDLGMTGSYVMNEIVDLAGLPQTQCFREGFPYPAFCSHRILSAEFNDAGNVVNAMCDGGRGPDQRREGGPPVPCAEVANRQLLTGPVFTPYTWTIDATTTVMNNLQIFALAEGQYGRIGSNTNTSCRHTCYANTRPGIFLDDPVYVEGTVFTARHPSDTNQRQRFNADFWRLREVGLRYQIPNHIAQRFGADRASIAASGRNLWTIWQHTKELYGAVIDDVESTNPSGVGSLGQMPSLSSFAVTMRVTF